MGSIPVAGAKKVLLRFCVVTPFLVACNGNRRGSGTEQTFGERLRPRKTEPAGETYSRCGCQKKARPLSWSGLFCIRNVIEHISKFVCKFGLGSLFYQDCSLLARKGRAKRAPLEAFPKVAWRYYFNITTVFK